MDSETVESPKMFNNIKKFTEKHHHIGLIVLSVISSLLLLGIFIVVIIIIIWIVNHKQKASSLFQNHIPKSKIKDIILKWLK